MLTQKPKTSPNHPSVQGVLKQAPEGSLVRALAEQVEQERREQPEAHSHTHSQLSRTALQELGELNRDAHEAPRLSMTRIELGIRRIVSPAVREALQSGAAQQAIEQSEAASQVPPIVLDRSPIDLSEQIVPLDRHFTPPQPPRNQN